jgi:hypothetical protein
MCVWPRGLRHAMRGTTMAIVAWGKRGGDGSYEAVKGIRLSAAPGQSSRMGVQDLYACFCWRSRI